MVYNEHQESQVKKDVVNLRNSSFNIILTSGFFSYDIWWII